MKNFRFSTFIFLIIFSQYGYSAEIKQTTFAFWDKPDVELFYLSPQNINKDTEVLFVIHGNSRNAKDYLKKWSPLIENKNIIVVAPLFTRESYRYFFLLESASSSGKVNNNSSDYLNNSISLFFNFFKNKFSLSNNTYKMYGHSAGAQFIHRYMLLSNDYRISNTVIANAGWYTFLNGSRFPYGIKDTPINIPSERVRWFMSSKTALLIGGSDTELQSLNTSKGAMRQGNNRLERANNYFSTLILLGEENKIPFRWSFHLIKDVAHSNAQMTPAAAKILLAGVENIKL
jgi:hypothetical protein